MNSNQTQKLYECLTKAHDVMLNMIITLGSLQARPATWPPCLRPPCRTPPPAAPRCWRRDSTCTGDPIPYPWSISAAMERRRKNAEMVEPTWGSCSRCRRPGSPERSRRRRSAGRRTPSWPSMPPWRCGGRGWPRPTTRRTCRQPWLMVRSNNQRARTHHLAPQIKRLSEQDKLVVGQGKKN